MKITKRQEQVLTYIQKGASNQKIADELGITLATVKVHVGVLLRKYNAKNRTQLALVTLGDLCPSAPDLEAKPRCWIKLALNKIIGVMLLPPKNTSEWDPVYSKIDNKALLAREKASN